MSDEVSFGGGEAEHGSCGENLCYTPSQVTEIIGTDVHQVDKMVQRGMLSAVR